jgi:heterotetrameric sarcosine oxidase gamma subunit
MPLKLSPIAFPPAAVVSDASGWRVVDSYASVESELSAARDRVALADLSSLGKIQIEGEAAAAVFQSVLGGAPQGIGQSWQGVYAIRPDLFLLLTPAEGEAELLPQLAAARAAQPGLVTVSDLTHGLAALALFGPHSRDVLRRLCALDVSDAAFPNDTARPTSLAKTRQIIVRSDVRATVAFTLVGARSLAAYVWQALLETGRDFGIAPIGAAAVEALAQGARD